MSKIEQIENLLKGWEASYSESTKLPFSINAREEKGVCKGLRLALCILKEPSNTRMHVDACVCHEGKFWQEKMAKFCGNCRGILPRQ